MLLSLSCQGMPLFCFRVTLILQKIDLAYVMETFISEINNSHSESLQ